MPVGREWPHNFAVLARGLLNGDFMFRTICEFNKLRVAKTACSATPARSICRPAFSGMMCIISCDQKMSAANEPTCFALLVKIFLSSALSVG